ncbi:IS5 family transposase [Micromonospora sp. NPDC005305]|uniref:IS5 family transposase n=1 Tax=Micromonospora sp. NPDC005305 TaxID=3156875 RepID=UPI0033A17245
MTDRAWAAIEPVLPKPGARSGRWRDHRQVINGILWKLRTGAPWRDLPKRYGPWKTCHERLRRWTADGTWDCILARAQVYDDGQPVEWVVSVDSSNVRAHQDPACPQKGGSARFGSAGATVRAQDGEAIGRSRGGLTTKTHLAVDGRGRPLSTLLTPGQAGDNPQLLPLLDSIRVKGPGLGRPRKRPDMLIADKAYAHDPTRRALRRRRTQHTIPERSDQIARRVAEGSTGGRPPTFQHGRFTGPGTSWSAASIASNTGVTWPPAMPSAPAAPAWFSSPPSFGYDDRQNLAGPSGGNGLFNTETLAACWAVRAAKHVGQLLGDVGMAIGNRASMQAFSDTRQVSRISRQQWQPLGAGVAQTKNRFPPRDCRYPAAPVG